MWTFFGNLMPGPVWTWVGGLVLALVGAYLSYRFGRRAERTSDQRQILKDLLLAISSERIKEPPDRDDPHEQSDWWGRYSEAHSLINDLLCQSSCQDLRSRLRAIDIISPLHWSTGNGEVSAQLEGELQALGTTEARLRAVILDDAYQVVAAAIRGEDIPILEENEELAGIEAKFIGYGGEHPNL